MSHASIKADLELAEEIQDGELSQWIRDSATMRLVAINKAEIVSARFPSRSNFGQAGLIILFALAAMVAFMTVREGGHSAAMGVIYAIAGVGCVGISIFLIFEHLEMMKSRIAKGVGTRGGEQIAPELTDGEFDFLYERLLKISTRKADEGGAIVQNGD